MKKAFKLIGIAAVCAALCFSMAACEEYAADVDVSLTLISADGHATQTTTELTLVFSRAIDGLAAKDITLSGVSGIQKGKFSGTNPYKLEISGFTTSGTVTVAVAKKDGYNITVKAQPVSIYHAGSAPIPVTFSSLSANGSATQATTQLSLSFSAAITGLLASDITLSGVTGIQKGVIGGSGTSYTLGVSGVTTSGSLTVKVEKAGYTINDSPKTVQVYSGSTAVSFNSATVSSSADGTNFLTLTFSAAITGLGAGDINLSGVSGVGKGTFSGSNPYYLTITGVTSSTSGTLSVKVEKTGYTISPDTQTVQITVISFSSVTADGSPNVSPTEWLTLNFSGQITGLASSDIKLEGVEGIGKGDLKDSNPYKLSIFDFNASGTLTVSVTKTGYIITGSPKTVNINYATPVINSLDAFNTWLSKLQPNSASAPYSVKLDVSDLGAVSSDLSVGKLLNANPFKYVNLDLSVSKFTTIEASAFSQCSGLTGIIIPTTVNSIGTSAFFGCTSLASVTFMGNSGINKIGSNAFTGCSKLAAIAIPNQVDEIGDNTFSGCASLTSVSFEGTKVTRINQSAFSGCTNLAIVSLGSVTKIDQSAFSGCEKLATLSIPATVTDIGISAFSGCARLVSVIFEGTSALTVINDSVFENCASLISITMPSALTTIKTRAFAYCASLVSVDIPSTVTAIGANAFLSCAKLESITIPDGITTIESGTFSNCSSLDSVIFNETAGVTSIGVSAFASCSSLESVTIPAKVSSIGNSAFDGCTSLTEVVFEDRSTPSPITLTFGTNTFIGDLSSKYSATGDAGGDGTYKRTGTNVWTKQTDT